jgi:hypothetical protein
VILDPHITIRSSAKSKTARNVFSVEPFVSFWFTEPLSFLPSFGDPGSDILKLDESSRLSFLHLENSLRLVVAVWARRNAWIQDAQLTTLKKDFRAPHTVCTWHRAEWRPRPVQS